MRFLAALGMTRGKYRELKQGRIKLRRL
jgi:hypothetical protein